MNEKILELEKAVLELELYAAESVPDLDKVFEYYDDWKLMEVFTEKFDAVDILDNLSSSEIEYWVKNNWDVEDLVELNWY